MNYKTYALLNSLYRNFVHSCDLSDCFIIMRHLMTLKKKDIFEADSANDAYDLIFITLIKFVETNRVPPDIVDYIHLCKDLFYYRCKIKERYERANLLFYSVFVLVHRRVKFQTVDYKPSSSVAKKVSNNMEYLFVWFKYDQDLVNLVRSDRELSKQLRRDEKLVVVDGTEDREKCTVDIIRL